MRQMKTFLLLSAVIFIGCDRSVPLEINSNEIYFVDTSCGRIEFKASRFSRWITIYQDTKSGEFELNLDSLAVLVYPKGFAKIDTIKFYSKGEAILNNKRIAKSGDMMSIYLVFEEPRPTAVSKLIILPSNYLTCNSIPLISDTIRISF
jgi:hypothetical protein